MLSENAEARRQGPTDAPGGHRPVTSRRVQSVESVKLLPRRSNIQSRRSAPSVISPVKLVTIDATTEVPFEPPLSHSPSLPPLHSPSLLSSPPPFPPPPLFPSSSPLSSHSIRKRARFSPAWHHRNSPSWTATMRGRRRQLPLAARGGTYQVGRVDRERWPG